MEEEHENDKFFKCIVIGSGKYTSPILQHFRDPASLPPIDTDYLTYSTIIDKQKIILQLWDMSGQQRFRTITSGYYRSARIFLVVFSFTDQTSFNEVKTFLREIDNNAPKNAVKILVATDAELFNQRAIDSHTAREFAENCGLHFFEVNGHDRDSVMHLVMDGIQRALVNFAQVDRLRIDKAPDEGPRSEGGHTNYRPSF